MCLIHAEDEAKQMGDEYVSVEHLFLSLLKYASKEMKADLSGIRDQPGRIPACAVYCQRQSEGDK